MKTLEKTQLFATCQKVLLKDIIEGVTQHVSKWEEGNILGCVHIKFTNDRLQFIAIDGSILAILNLPLDIHEKPENEITLNIQAETLKTILPLLKSKEGNEFIHIYFSEEGLMVKDPITETELNIKQSMEGIFPKYEQLIPDLKDEKFRKFGLNYRYLKQVSKTFSSPRTAGLVFFQAGLLDGIVMKRMEIKHQLSQDDLILLMPIQVDGNKDY